MWFKLHYRLFRDRSLNSVFEIIARNHVNNELEIQGGDNRHYNIGLSGESAAG